MIPSASSPDGHRVQVSGYLLWVELRGDLYWYIVDEAGGQLAGPYNTEASALWNARRMTDTSGT